MFRLQDGQIISYMELRNAIREFREEGRELKYPNIEKFEAMYEIVADHDDWDAPFVPAAPWDPEVQKKNTETIRQFLGCQGADCANRWRLFTEDCTAGPGYSLGGKVRRIMGLEKLKKAEALRAQCFPDWKFGENQFHRNSRCSWDLTWIFRYLVFHPVRTRHNAAAVCAAPSHAAEHGKISLGITRTILEPGT